MNTKTMRKAARDVVLGDIWHADGRRCVVFAIEASTEPNKFLYIHSVALGFVNGIACAEASLNSQLDIELPAGLTPVQAKADELLGYVRVLREYDRTNQYGMAIDKCRELDALLDELDPPKPPTLEEAVGLLREVRKSLHPDSDFAARADALLKRVPEA